MGNPFNSRSLLTGISFTRTSAEIKKAIVDKSRQIKDKLKEREGRIGQLRESYGISDQDMIQLLSQFASESMSNARLPSTASYSVGGSGESQPRTIGAGVVQNLLTERGLIESEKEQLEKIELISRNIRPLIRYSDGVEYVEDSFEVSQTDLEFFGL